MTVNANTPCRFTIGLAHGCKTFEFTNILAGWSPNDRVLQSPISTVCGQYCIALMFRCVKFQCVHVLTYSLPI